MRISPYLSPERVHLNPDLGTKWELIDLLARSLGDPEEGAEIARIAREREEQFSTGLERGVALPHALMPSGTKTRGALALFSDGLEFDALDGLPARFVVFMAFPDEPEGRKLHIGLLAASIRIFTHAPTAGSLLAAAHAEEVLSSLAKGEEALLSQEES